MKKIICLVACIFFLASTCNAEDYILNVKRVSSNVYDTDEGVIIITKFCYEYANDEKALLRWDGPYSYSSELIFLDSKNSCDVEKVLRKD